MRLARLRNLPHQASSRNSIRSSPPQGSKFANACQTDKGQSVKPGSQQGL